MNRNKLSENSRRASFKKGSGIVEILVGVFIFTIVLGSLIIASNMYLSGASENLRSAKGSYLAEEGIEAVKIMRDTSWDTISALSTTTNYYLSWDNSSSTWKSTITATTTDSIFIRTFRLYPVYRNSDGKSTTTIASGYTVDLYTKIVTVSVSWKNKNATTTKTLSTYITDII
jgi:hypothetical protein